MSEQNSKTVKNISSKNVFGKFILFAFKTYKKYFTVVAFKCITLSIQTIFNAYTLSILISSLEFKDYHKSIIAGFCLAGINLILNILNKLVIRLISIHQVKMREALDHRICFKLTKIPYQYLEDPHYLDLAERARFAIENEECIDTLLTSSANMIQYIMTFIGLSAIMISFDFKLIIILGIAVLFNIILMGIFFKTQLKFYDDNLDVNRKFNYYVGVLLDNKNGKDFRIYPIGSFLRDKYNWFAKKICDFYNEYLRKSFSIKSLMQVVKYIEMLLVYGLVAVRTIVNRLPVSSFSLYVSTALSFSSSVSTMINTSMSFISGLRLINPIIELMEIKDEEEVGKKIPLQDTIQTLEFRNVTFSYPKTTSLILKDISFKVNAGEKISIVGLNGAGKTTLVKLLCRLYRPNSGDILINEISIYDYEYNSYIQQISTLFQDFKLFAYSLKENILNNDGTDEEAYAAICKVGLKDKIDSLPEGINSLYMKSFDEGGVELSGGETQKLAFARVLHSKASIIILDEPTSALDPIAEAEFYQNFNSTVQDKTVIYISHRMSSAIFSDKILVIDSGIISEFDTHTNLMRKTESLYYKLYKTQAENYAG